LRRRLDAPDGTPVAAAAIAADPLTLDFAPYLASLIVSEDADGAGSSAAVRTSLPDSSAVASLRRVACLQLPGDRQPEDGPVGRCREGRRLYSERQAGDLTLREPPGTAAWLRALGGVRTPDAGNTRCSRDTLVMARWACFGSATRSRTG